MAQSGHANRTSEFSLFGVTRTSRTGCFRSARPSPSCHIPRCRGPDNDRFTFVDHRLVAACEPLHAAALAPRPVFPDLARFAARGLAVVMN